MSLAPLSAPYVPLTQGETHLATWRPKFLFFLQPALIVAALTCFISGVSLPTTPLWGVAIFPTMMLFYVFVFDDHTKWLRHRHDTWHLTDQRLIYENHQALEENASVLLEDIQKMTPWFWWSLHLVRRDRRVIVMQFVARPGKIRAMIAAMIDAPAPDFQENANAPL